MFEIIVKRIETKDVRENSWHKTADSGNPNGHGPIYGYVENVQTREIETEMYRQKVETLNLADVVSVVNGILEQIVNVTNATNARTLEELSKMNATKVSP